jgi:primosomal protein N' (replication factor Y) (superfamily II helicase)
VTSTRPQRAGRVAATTDAVAHLMVDVPLAHLDRPFDYLVPAELDEAVVPGVRVRVRFAGRLVDGFVLDRGPSSDHDGRLAFLDRVVGREPALTLETATLFRAVADRYAGTFADVVRLGVPARHAGAESRPLPAAGPVPAGAVPAGPVPGWDRYRAGPSFLAAVRDQRPARAAWSALAGEAWPERLAEAVATALAVNRGALVVVPDARDLARLDAAMTGRLGRDQYVALSADLGPAERYRRWLAVRRGAVRAVIGTRAAGFAPVADLGLIAIWDDGDDLYAEPRAPYPHARDVLIVRSTLTGAALLVGGYVRTAETAQLVETGWAHEIVADRSVVRAAAPRISAIGDDAERARDPAATAARLPSLAWRAARDALESGRPVLVQVARRGYVPALACVRDRTPARCPTCSGPLATTSGHAIPSCRWCGRPAGSWRCPRCGGRRMRALVVGSARTAEELGRAFPGVPVRTSSGDTVLAQVPDGPGLVVATPGAEPPADGGYGAALLLDGWALLSRADLRAAEETFRRWSNAAALVRSDGRVVIGAEAAVPTVQALVRWDAAGHAARELAERAALGFPPAVRMASLTGAPGAVADVIELAQLPEPSEVIGPVPTDDDGQRLLVRVPRQLGGELAASLKAAAAIRSARKAADPVRIVLDPTVLF